MNNSESVPKRKVDSTFYIIYSSVAVYVFGCTKFTKLNPGSVLTAVQMKGSFEFEHQN